MGCLFYFEVPILFEEVEPHVFDSYDDFIKKTKDNYLAVSNLIFLHIYLDTFFTYLLLTNDPVLSGN